MGNTLLSDDGLGILVKRHLEHKLHNCYNLDFTETSWGGFRIIDLLQGYDYVIVIDTIKTCTQPAGYIHHLKPDNLLHTLRLNSYHDINFITAITLGRELNFMMPHNIDIYAIEIENNFTFAESISPTLTSTINECTNEILIKLAEKNILSPDVMHKEINSFVTYSDVRHLYFHSVTEPD